MSDSNNGKAPGHPGHPILLFDGKCNFCRACVKWTAKRDSKGTMRYAALQSPAGARLLEAHGLPPDYDNSVALIDDDGTHLRSDAVLRLLRHVGGGWRFAAGLRVLPRFARDLGYELVSRNRSVVSKAVGTRDHRWEPPPELKDRFLGDTDGHH